MKLTFVGTSHGIPAADRFCSCYMIEAGSGVYFVDAGTSIADAMSDYGVEPSRLRAIFTTHQHGDHTNGLIHTASSLSERSEKLNCKIYFTHEEIIAAYRKYLAATLTSCDAIDFRLAECGEIYRDENVSVTYHETQHLKGVNRPAYGIVIRELCGTGASVLFSGDLSFRLALGDYPTEQAAEPHELFVCEMAHFYPEHIEKYFANSRVQNLAITHLSKGEEKIPLIEAMAKGLPYPTMIPKDGDVLEISKGEVKKI